MAVVNASRRDETCLLCKKLDRAGHIESCQHVMNEKWAIRLDANSVDANCSRSICRSRFGLSIPVGVRLDMAIAAFHPQSLDTLQDAVETGKRRDEELSRIDHVEAICFFNILKTMRRR